MESSQDAGSGCGRLHGREMALDVETIKPAVEHGDDTRCASMTWRMNLIPKTDLALIVNDKGWSAVLSVPGVSCKT
jgi:hypothetical protein